MFQPGGHPRFLCCDGQQSQRMVIFGVIFLGVTVRAEADASERSRCRHCDWWMSTTNFLNYITLKTAVSLKPGSNK